MSLYHCILGVYSIIYEETDESLVDVVYLPTHGNWGQQLEPHAYPKPGELAPSPPPHPFILLTFACDGMHPAWVAVCLIKASVSQYFLHRA